MMRSRRVLFFLVAAILVVIVYAGYGMVRAGREDTPMSVSVIVGSSGSDRWTAFREGLDQGAKEFGVYINVISAGEIGSIEEEAAIVRREVENGADGIIVEPCAEDEDGLLRETLTGVSALFVGTESREDETLDTVMPDSYEMGLAVVESVLAGESTAQPLRIGILAGNQRQLAMRRCLDGFLERIRSEDVDIRWTISEKELSEELLAPGDAAVDLSALLAQGTVDVVVALDDQAMEKAVDEISLLRNSASLCRLYGVGRSKKNIYSLDSGVISALVVPDEYYMGYLAIERISGKELSSGGRGIELLTVTAETLYDKGTEGILFPDVR